MTTTSSEASDEIDFEQQVRKTSIDIYKNPTDFARIESWYPVLKPYTFQTASIELTFAEAKAISEWRQLYQYQRLIHYQEQLEKARGDKKKTIYDDVKIPITSDQEFEPEIHLSAEDEQTLQKLQRKLDDAIRPYVQSAGGAFVKLSTRSPKDAALSSTKIREYIKSEITKCKAKPTPENETQEQKHTREVTEDLIIFTRGCCEALKVTTGEEALQLLIRSSRTSDDILMHTLQAGEENFKMNIIVREWFSSIKAEWEFRVFVHNNRITAITQYYSVCYVPEIAKRAEEIKSRIVRFFEETLKELMTPLSTTYTVDFYVPPDEDKLYLIEINHPPPTAGSSLFDWHKPEDRKLIVEGDCEFRVLTTPQLEGMKEIHEPLAYLIDKLRGRLPESTSEQPGSYCSLL